jgi:long-chain fatty acid transport protein
MPRRQRIHRQIGPAQTNAYLKELFREKNTLVTKTVPVFLLSVVMAGLALSSAFAGGLWLYEEATPDMGVGGAGRQAAGLDASTASGNPAAMTRLDRTQVEGGFMGLYVDSKFDVKNSSHGDNGGGNAGYFSPAGTMYLVHSVSPDFKIGLGVGTYFGLGVNYTNEWAGKYYVQSASFTTMAVNPTVAYKFAEWISVDGGVSVVQGSISERVAINTLLEPSDGRLKYDANDTGYGYNLGALFTISPQTRIGVTYVSQVNFDFKDEMRFKNVDGTVLGAALAANGLLDADLKINVNLPAQLSFGAYHALTDTLALVGTVNWQNWSRFGQPEISVADSNTVPILAIRTPTTPESASTIELPSRGFSWQASATTPHLPPVPPTALLSSPSEQLSDMRPVSSTTGAGISLLALPTRSSMAAAPRSTSPEAHSRGIYPANMTPTTSMRLT